MTRSTRAQAVRFLGVGGANTLLTYFIYLALLNFVSYRLAFSVTFVLGIVIGYYLNTSFVFDSSFSWRKFFKYPLIYVFQYIVGLFLLMVLVDFLEIDSRLAPLLSVVLLMPLTFLMNRRLLT